MKTIRLHTVRGRNKYCGPAAISALAGVSTDDAARAIREYSGRRAVRGAHLLEVDYALHLLSGLRTVPTPNPGQLTLARWCRERSPEDKDKTFLLCVGPISRGNHWIVVQGNYQVDSHQREPVFLKDAKHRRKYVEAVWEIR